MRGSYRLEDCVETWSAGPGPQGLRYVARRDDGDTLDLVTDLAGRALRLEAQHDGWVVRGGVAGDEVHWTRGEDSHHARAVGFTGSSPAYDLAVAALLQLQVGQTARLALVEVSEPVGAARTVEHGWARTADPEQDVQRYEVADLQTGERWVLHLSGSVLVSREGRAPAVLTSLT